MTRKEIATDFLQLAGLGRVQDAFDRYVALNFRHHNQYFRGDRQSLLDAMADAHRQSPNSSIETIHVYEDGQTVITHSRVNRADPTAQPIAVVHIFRFEGDKIAELWDVAQPMAPDSPNEYGMF